MARARRKWKQLELRPRTWGGAREGAGRKRSDRAGVPHRPRAKVGKKTALHVTVRLVRDVKSLRRFKLAPAMRKAFAATAHKDTPHYLTWRSTVEAWMAEPRHGVRYDGLYPEVPEIGA